MAYDPSVVDVSWAPVPSHADEPEVTTELQLVQQRLAEVPEGLEVVVPPRVVGAVDGAVPGAHVSVRYRYVKNPMLIDERVIGFVHGAIVRVDVTAWADLPGAYDGLAQRVLGSFEPSR